MRRAAPLIIGHTQRTALAALREKAAAEPIDMPPVMEAIRTPEGNAAHIKRMGAYTIEIPTAFAVTFSIETGHPGGTMRHVSMSSHQHGRTPTPEAVWMVAAELGFVGDLSSCMVWLEDIGRGDKAVNLVQPVRMTSPTRETKT